jgi:hypothetical protein
MVKGDDHIPLFVSQVCIVMSLSSLFQGVYFINDWFQVSSLDQLSKEV